ncbi:hypothetical protein P3S67_008933 [Capsicum chacoense]
MSFSDSFKKFLTFQQGLINVLAEHRKVGNHRLQNVKGLGEHLLAARSVLGFTSQGLGEHLLAARSVLGFTIVDRLS